MKRKWNPDEMSYDAYRMRNAPVLGEALQFYDDLKQPWGNPLETEGRPVLSDMSKIEQMEALGNYLPVVDSGGLSGMLKKVSPYLKGVKEGDELIGMHNLSADNLEHAQSLGGLPVPSMAIAKSSIPFNKYGEISLIADKEMVSPSRMNPVFGADAYSKRYPHIDENNGKIFKGYTDMGNRRYAPHTLENVVKEMKGRVANSEGYQFGTGGLRAEYAPRMRSLRDVQKNRGSIVPEGEMEAVRSYNNIEGIEIAEALLPYDKHNRGKPDNIFMYIDTAIARLSPQARLSDYYENVPDSLLERIQNYKTTLKQSPTEYFEAKPQRAVRLQEFSGAVVPHDASSRTLEILNKNNINDIHKYSNVESYRDENAIARAEALKNFNKYMFGVGGTAVAAPLLSEREAHGN